MLLKPEDLPLINLLLSQDPELCQDLYRGLKLMQHQVGRLCATAEAMRQTTPPPVDLTETDSESTGSAQDLTRSERAQEMLTWVRKNYSVGQHIPPGVIRRELGFSKEHFTNSVRELISESTLKSNDEHGLKRRYWLVSR